MADLTWPGDVMLLSAIGTVALLLVSYFASWYMAKKNITLQVKPKAKSRK